MSGLITFLLLACSFLTSNAWFLTDLVVGYPGNNTICTGLTTAVTLDGYLNNVDDYLRFRSTLRLFIIVDDEVTEVRRLFDQSIHVTFRFFGIHIIHARVCYELNCVNTRYPTYVITRHGDGRHHCTGRIALNLPYIDDVPATVTLTGVIVQHLLSNTPFDENGHYIPIAVPSSLSQTWVAVCMIVNGYMILPEQGNNYRDRCFVHDNVTSNVQIDSQRSSISMLFIEINSHHVVVRTDIYIVPPSDEPIIPSSLSKSPSSSPTIYVPTKNQNSSRKPSDSSSSSHQHSMNGCNGLRVIGLYDATLSEGFYWHDSGLEYVMSLAMGAMKRTEGDENVAICSVRLLVVMDAMMSKDPTFSHHSSTTTYEETINTGNHHNNQTNTNKNENKTSMSASIFSASTVHCNGDNDESFDVCVDRLSDDIIAQSDVLFSINAINGHTTDYIDVDSFAHLRDTLHKPPLSALHLLQTISAKRSKAIEDTKKFDLFSTSMLKCHEKIHHEFSPMKNGVNHSLLHHNSTFPTCRYHQFYHHPFVIQLVDATEHILLPYGFELDAMMTPSHALAEISTIAQFRVPMVVVPPLLMSSYRWYQVARWAVAKVKALTKTRSDSTWDYNSEDTSENESENVSEIASASKLKDVLVDVSESYLPICQHHILHIATSSLDQISAFQFVEMAQQILALTAKGPGLGPGLAQESASGQGLEKELGPICFRLLVPGALRVAVSKAITASVETKIHLLKYFSVATAEAPTFFPPLSWYSKTFNDDGDVGGIFDGDRGGRGGGGDSNEDGNDDINGDDVDERHHIYAIALELALADVMVVGTSTKGSYPSMLGALAIVVAQQQQQQQQQQYRINEQSPPQHLHPLGVVVSICTPQSMEAKRQEQKLFSNTPYLLIPSPHPTAHIFLPQEQKVFPNTVSRHVLVDLNGSTTHTCDLFHCECYSPLSPSTSSSTTSSSTTTTPLALAHAIVTILKDASCLHPTSSLDSSSSAVPILNPSPGPIIPADISFTPMTVKTAQELMTTLHSLYQRQQLQQQQPSQQQEQSQQQRQQRGFDDDVTAHHVDHDVHDYADGNDGVSGGVCIGGDDAADEASLLRAIVDPLIAFDGGSDQHQDKGYSGQHQDKGYSDNDIDKEIDHDNALQHDEQSTISSPLSAHLSPPLPVVLASIIPQHHTRWLAGDYSDIDMSEFSVEESFEKVMHHVRAYPGAQGNVSRNYLTKPIDTETSFTTAIPATTSTTNTTSTRSNHHHNKHHQQHQHQQQPQLDQSSSDRILCLTYTIDQRHRSVRAIIDTWGKRCDGYLAASNATDTTINAFNLRRRGPEAFGNIWQKVRSALMIVYQYLFLPSSPLSSPRYDWIFVSGDDTYVMIDSLRMFLQSMAVQQLQQRGERLFVGGTWMWNRGLIYNHGGGGYLLNRAALASFVQATSSGRCYPHAVTSMEDVMVANCLQSIGITAYDTRDAMGRIRFHCVTPSARYTRPVSTIEGFSWGMDSRWDVGINAIAGHSLTFHFIKDPAAMRYIHYDIYYKG